MLAVKQLYEHDCGFACLKFLLANFHKCKDYLYLPQEEDKKSYSFQDLVKLGDKYGLTLFGFEMSNKKEIEKRMPSPCIVSMYSDKGMKHAVILIKAKKKHFLIFDPIKGKIKMDKREFYALWDGKGLFVSSYTKKKIRLEKETSFLKKERFILSIFQIASIISMVTSIYFVDEKFDFFLPLIFISIFFVFEILSKAYSFKLMSKIDSLYLNSLTNIPSNKIKFMKRLEKYKVGIINTPLKLFSSGLLALFLIVVMILNNLYNAVPILIISIIILFEQFFLSPKNKLKIHNINKFERKLNTFKDIDNFKNGYYSLHKSTYKLGIITLISKGIILFLIIISNLIVLLITKSISTGHLIFNTCIQYYIYDSIKRLILSIDERKNLKEDFLRLHNQTCLNFNKK